ncbi:MAG: ABC transporter substrate-binding protein [Myxococcota bacterium]
MPRLRPISRFAAGLVRCGIAGLLAGCPSGTGGVEAQTDGGDPSLQADRAVEALLADERARAGATGRAAERTLVIGVRDLPRTFDPLSEQGPWARRVIDDLLFEGLTRRRADVAPFAEPGLADACVVDPPQGAPRDVYCHLPAEAVFHDGNPVLVEDVVFSLEYWLDPRRATLRARHGLDELRSIEVVDRPYGAPELRDAGRWIRIGFDRPEPLALERVAAMKIVPRKARRGKTRAFGAEPIGTGPMRLSAVEEERVVFDRVAPDADADVVQRIVLRQVPDGAAGLVQLRRGDIHILGSVAPVHVPDELAKPGMAPRFSAFLLTPPQYDVVLYNLRNGAQSGPRMREALDLGIPRGQLGGAGMPPAQARTVVDLQAPHALDLPALAEAGVSVQWGMAGLPTRAVYDDVSDAAQASTVLDALDWSLERGVRRKATGNLRLVLMWDGEGARARTLASRLKESWGALGIQVPYATASWSYLSGLMRRGEFDMALVRLVTRSDEDLYPLFHSRGAHNITGVADAVLDAALEAYRAAATAQERQLAKASIARRLEELRPISLLHAPTEVMLVSNRVRGLRFLDDKPMLSELGLGPERSWLSGNL